MVASNHYQCYQTLLRRVDGIVTAPTGEVITGNTLLSPSIGIERSYHEEVRKHRWNDPGTRVPLILGRLSSRDRRH